MSIEKFDYEKVEEKYEDSLSKYDFDKIFNNPDHGELNFLEIKDEFLSFYKIIYELESLDYKESLHQKEIDSVDGIRNQVIIYFNQIQQFNIVEGPDAPARRQNIINPIRKYIATQIKILDDILIKIKTKNFFASSKGDATLKQIRKEQAEIEKEKNKIISIREDAEQVKNKLEEEIRNIKSLKIKSTAKRAGEVKVSQFFSVQADEHRVFAENKKSGWEKEREKFFKYIYVLLGVSIFLYLTSFCFAIWTEYLDVVGWNSFWNLRAGVFIFSLLSVFYTGLYFATKNYSKEKSLEYQNKNRSNIANTINLMSAGEENPIKEIIYSEACKTIFSDVKEGSSVKDSKGQNIQISLPSSNITKTLNKNIESG